MGAKVAMDFTQYKDSAPMAIEKIKILGALLELPGKQHCQSSLQFYSLFAIVKITFFRLIRMTALPNKNIY